MTLPTFVGSAAGSSIVNTQLTVFSAADLSNCNLAVVVAYKGVVSGGEDLSLDAGSSVGWTKLAQQRDGSTLSVSAIFYKKAPTASETLIINGSTASSSAMTSQVIRLATANNLAAASSPTLDPPSLDAGAVRDHLWVAASTNGNSTTYVGWPTGYTNTAHFFDTSNGAQGSATKSGAASQVEDPSAFSAGGITNRRTSWTIATWFEVPTATCTPVDSAHTSASTEPTMLFDTQATPADAAHASSSTEVVCGAVGRASAADTAHAASSSQPTLTPAASAAPSATHHTLASTSPAQTAYISTSPASVLHTLFSGEPICLALGEVPPAPTHHAFASTSPICLPAAVAALPTAFQALHSTSPSFVPFAPAAPASTLHTHLATSPLATYITPAAADTLHTFPVTYERLLNRTPQVFTVESAS